MTITLPSSYTDIPTIYATVPLVASLTSVTSEQILLEVGKAQSFIDSKLAKRFSVPFSSAPPLVVSLCTDISLYYILTKRLYASDRMYDERMVSGLERAFDVLDSLADGSMTMVDSSGAAVTETMAHAATWSNTKDYEETFHEGDFELTIRDDDKLDNIYDDRDL